MTTRMHNNYCNFVDVELLALYECQSIFRQVVSDNLCTSVVLLYIFTDSESYHPKKLKISKIIVYQVNDGKEKNHALD